MNSSVDRRFGWILNIVVWKGDTYEASWRDGRPKEQQFAQFILGLGLFDFVA